MTMWSGYPNYGSKNRKGGNLKRKGKIKNENKMKIIPSVLDR